jgi:hypothetical protein
VEALQRRGEGLQQEVHARTASERIAAGRVDEAGTSRQL